MAEDSLSDLTARDGHQVTVHGVARTGAAGALVLLGDGSPVYIDELWRWPRDLEGVTVEVKGTVRTRAAQVASGDPTAHGLSSETVVLDDASWAPVAGG